MTDKMHPISAGLDALKARLLVGLPPDEAAVAAWDYVCGQRVAENARAKGFADGVLTVAVPDDGWRRELTGMAATYVAKLNQVLPSKIRRIDFVKG